jgi:hypothetical protein
LAATSDPPDVAVEAHEFKSRELSFCASVIGELGAHAEGKGPAIQPALSILSQLQTKAKVECRIEKTGKRRP